MVWEVKTLDQISKNLDRKRVPITKKNRTHGSIPYYGASGIVDYVEEYIFDEELLLVSEDGANLLARTYPIAFSINGKTWVNNHAHVLRFKDKISQRFVELYLNSIKLDDFVSGMAQPKLNQKMLNKIPIPFPPISEQKRIVAILDEAFESIAKAKENAEKNLKNAKEIFEGCLQSVFENKGDGWKEKTLGSLSKFVSVGYVGPTSKFYCDKHEGIPFLRSQNVRPAKLSMKGIRYILPEFHTILKKSQLKSGDLLFVRVGANRGDCCSLPENLGEINCANIVFARPTEASPTFLELFCLSQIGRERLLSMTTGSAQGVINTKSVAELIVPLPNIKEQLAIETKLNLISSETKKLEVIYTQKLADLEELKKSILTKAFEGKLTEASV